MTSLYDLSATSCSKINWLNASLTPFMFSSCSFKQFAASSSRSGPNNCWLIPRRLFFNLEIDAVCLHLSKINLSGMMPIFWRANACDLVLGNPWIIQLWPLASNALICLDTISITILSSTKWYAFCASLILFPSSVFLDTSSLRRNPVWTVYHPFSSAIALEHSVLKVPGGPIRKILLIGGFSSISMR